jgi:hypothetical protein
MVLSGFYREALDSDSNRQGCPGTSEICFSCLTSAGDGEWLLRAILRGFWSFAVPRSSAKGGRPDYAWFCLFALWRGVSCIRRDSRSTALLGDIGITYRFIKMLATVYACRSLPFMRAVFFMKYHNYCNIYIYVIRQSLPFMRGKLGVIARFSTRDTSCNLFSISIWYHEKKKKCTYPKSSKIYQNCQS